MNDGQILEKSFWGKVKDSQQGLLALVAAFISGMAVLAFFGSLLAAPRIVRENQTAIAEMRGAQTTHVESYGHTGTVELNQDLAEIKDMVFELWCDARPAECRLQPR